MRTAMIDTMVFDALSADPPGREAVLAAIAARRLRLVTTHVQERQLADIRDPVRRKALQRIPREVVASAAPVLAVSRSGRPVLGPSPETHAIRRGPRHVADDVIAEVARARADCLVTEDRRLAEDARARGVETWTVATLIAWAREAMES